MNETLTKIKACNINGKIETFYLQNKTQEQINKFLLEKKLLPIKIKTKQQIKNKKNQKIILEFTKQMSLLLQNNLSIKNSLELISSMKGKNSIIANNLLEKIKTGISFSAAILENSIFPNFYKNIIKASDKTGSLEKIFLKLLNHLENKKKISDKIKNALIYPTIVFFTAVIIMFLLAVFILPKIKSVFSELNKNAAIELENNILKIQNGIQIFLIFLVIILTAAIIISILKKNNKEFAEKIDCTLLKIPVIKNLIIKFQMLNFSFLMETLLNANITIEESIKESKNVFANFTLKKSMQKILEQITKGSSLYDAFLNEEYFSKDMICYLKIAEHTGNTKEAFIQIRKSYEAEVENITQKFMNLIEPAIILFLGIIILIVVVNVVLPLLNIYGSLI